MARLEAKFTTIIAQDHRFGGLRGIETQASALAGEALSLLQRGTASQRVRNSLYACAASFTSSALWAAIDGRRFNEAQRYLDRASSLATMSADTSPTQSGRTFLGRIRGITKGLRVTDHGIELRHHRDLEPVWDTLIEVYAEVRADRLHDPHYSVERYGERLARHGSEPGWEAVVGYDGGEPVGYVYGNTIEDGDRYWQRITTPLDSSLTVPPTLALKELMVRVPWRKTGASRRLHDALLSERGEPQVTLMVNPRAGNGKVHHLYETWGYKDLGESQPSLDSPVLMAMLRDLRPASA